MQKQGVDINSEKQYNSKAKTKEYHKSGVSQLKVMRK